MRIDKEKIQSYFRNFFGKIRDIIIRPGVFFEDILVEVRISDVVLFFLVLQMMLVPVYMIMTRGVVGSTFSLLLWIFEIIVQGTLVLFGIVLFYHVFIYAFGGRAGILRTAQAIVYGLVPATLVGWIPFLAAPSLIYCVYLIVGGISMLHNMKMGKAVLAYSTPMLIIIVIGLVSSIIRL